MKRVYFPTVSADADRARAASRPQLRQGCRPRASRRQCLTRQPRDTMADEQRLTQSKRQDQSKHLPWDVIFSFSFIHLSAGKKQLIVF